MRTARSARISSSEKKRKILEDLRNQFALHPESEAIAKDAEKLISEIADHGRDFTRSYDRYTAAYSYLSAIAEHGTGKAQASAKTILKNDRTGRDFRNVSRRRRNRVESVPKVSELKSIFTDYPEVELAYLRRLRNQEMGATILAMSPSKYTMDKIKGLVQGVPGVNRKALGKFFDAALTVQSKEVFGPNIERIVASVGTPADKLEMLATLNAETDDRLLVTFARVVEDRAIWTEIYKEARTSDRKFYTRMREASEAAEDLGDISLDGQGSRSMLGYRAADLIILSTLGYFGYDEFFGKKQLEKLDDAKGEADDFIDELKDIFKKQH